MLEEPKDSVWQRYKERWGFKLTAVKNEPALGCLTVGVWGSCCSTVGQEKVKIFWKWRLHRWQIPLSVQMRLSKTKQPLSQRKKTNFPRIQPFLLPPFPQLLVHCQLTASSALSSLSFSEKIVFAACCCFPAPVTLLFPWTLHLPFPCSHSWFSLLTFCPIPSLPYHVLFKQKTLPLPVKPDSFTPLNLQSYCLRSFLSWRHQAKTILLMIQFQIYVLPAAFSDLLMFFCYYLHLLQWDLL